MKINDIVTEQKLDELSWGDVKAGAGKVGQAIKTGAQAVQRGVVGAQAGIAQARGRQQIDNDANYWFQRWNTDVVSGNPAAAQDPAALQKFASSFAGNLRGKVPAPTSMNPADIKTYIKQVIGQDVSASAAGQTAKTAAPTAPTQTAPTQSPAGIIVPQTVGGGARPAATPAAVPPGIPKQDFAPGVSVINQEPIILAYGRKQYGLDDNGQWVHLASGKNPHEGFQQFLSTQHDISLGTQQ